MSKKMFTKRIPGFIRMELDDLENLVALLSASNELSFEFDCGAWQYTCNSLEELISEAQANSLDYLTDEHSFLISADDLQVAIMFEQQPSILLGNPNNESLGIYVQIENLLKKKQFFPYKIATKVFCYGVVFGFVSALLHSRLLSPSNLGSLALLASAGAFLAWASISHMPHVVIRLQKGAASSFWRENISIIAGCISAIAGLASLLITIWQLL